MHASLCQFGELWKVIFLRADGDREVICQPYNGIPALDAAVTANPSAVASYAAAAVLCMGLVSAHCGPSHPFEALFDALTPALASASDANRASVASVVASTLRHLCLEADSATQSLYSQSSKTQQRLAVHARQLAAAAVLTRQPGFVAGLRGLQRAARGQVPAVSGQVPMCSVQVPTGSGPASQAGLSVQEQGALLQHILLCPAPRAAVSEKVAESKYGALQQECSLRELLSALQPMCENYCKACGDAIEAAACSSSDRLLQHWLPQQVWTARFFLSRRFVSLVRHTRATHSQ